MKIPPPPRERRSGLIAWLDEFYRAWRSSRPLRSETCEIHESPDGTQILPFGTAGAAFAAVAAECPLGVSDASDEEGFALRVAWGTINGMQPEGFDPDGKLFPHPPPKGFVYAEADFDFGSFATSGTRVEIYAQQKQSTVTTGRRLIASYTSAPTKGVKLAHVCGNVVISICELPDAG